MSIIDTFDDKTKEILHPSNLINKVEDFPEVAILVFKERFFNYLQEDFGMKVIGHINAGLFIPVYKLKFHDKEFAITRTTIGAPGTAGTTEDLIAMGAKKILIFGTCGTLYKDILKEFGIDASVIRPDNEDKHVLPAIKLKDGRKIKADIQQDLYLIQTRSRLKNVKSVNGVFGKNIVTPEHLTQILIDIGYIKNEKDYRDEKIEEVKKEIQYENAQEALTKILEDKRICEVEDKLGYIEATKYYKSVLNQIIPQYLDRKIYKVDCYREQENQEREYLLCLYAEENATIRPYIFSNKLNRFVRTDLEQLNQWQEEGLVIGVGHKRDGSKKLKKYMKKQQRAKKEGVVQE